MLTTRNSRSLVAIVGSFALSFAQWANAEERIERFHRDPGWEAHNNTLGQKDGRTVRQDFGWSQTAHAGGARGEIGGFITPAAEPAYYAKKLDTSDFNKPLSASGTLSCSDRGFHVLVGFFNANSVNEWRTPNTIALRLSGRGDSVFAYVEYCTVRWRAGGDDPQGFDVPNAQTGRRDLRAFPVKQPIRWTLRYDPAGNAGQGVITATVGEHTAVCNLAPGHKQDGATFNRCGLLNVMKSVDGGGELWLDDMTINDQKFDFATDPGWDAVGNRREYTSHVVRALFDFGYRPTQFAGGRDAGELGGLLFRGDCRYADKLAWYADKFDSLTLEKPLRIAGKIALKRGVSDSGVLLGFFNSTESTAQNPAQDTGLPKSYFGLSTDAPSREGFYLAPTFRLVGDARASLGDAQVPHLLPDGKCHDFSFDYDPHRADARGEITVKLDDQAITIQLPKGARQAGTRFDRFGIITPWIDGNSQSIFFDDLQYTVRQE